jgi:hypothetical protein
MQKFDKALVYIETGRRNYPGNPYFLLKRAVILESKKKYLEAWRAMDTLSKMEPLDQKALDYKDLLYGKTLRDELGISYINSTFDPLTINGNTSTRRYAQVYYSHRYDQGSLAAKIDYAGTTLGSGFAYELEGTLQHTPKTYSWANLSYSNFNLIFAPWRLGYSLFHSFDRGYDAELGIRYVPLDTNKVYVGVMGLSKEWRDFYFTGHIYLTDLSYFGTVAGPYRSYLLTTKYYVKEDHTSSFIVLVGYGLAPDDISRILSFNYQEILYNTVTTGVGYAIQLHYRTTLAINYTWYNIEYHVSTGPGDSDAYKNQYDLNLVLSHRF